MKRHLTILILFALVIAAACGKSKLEGGDIYAYRMVTQKDAMLGKTNYSIIFFSSSF